jgi:uncharacterized protein
MVTVEAARAWYPKNDPVHGFDHILRVYRLAKRIAQAEGGDLEIVRAAALLHDAGGQNRGRSGHHHGAADFARRILSAQGWGEKRIRQVQHCIHAHRFRDASQAPHSLEAKILFDADKLDAIGAIGVARALAYAVRAGQPFYAPPSPRFLQSGEVEPGEAHSAYHEYVFKLRKLKDRLYTLTAREMAASRHRLMSQYFERLAQENEAVSSADNEGDNAP